MTYLSGALDYSKSFFKGSFDGYKAISQVQSVTYAVSGMWIGDYLCQRYPCDQLVEKVNAVASQPVQWLVDTYSVRRYRSLTELKIRLAVHAQVQKNLDVAKDEINLKIAELKKQLPAHTKVVKAYAATALEKLAQTYPLFDLILRVYNYLITLPIFKKAVDEAAIALQKRCQEELTKWEQKLLECEKEILSYEDLLVAESMSILDDQIFNNSSEFIRGVASEASKYAVHFLIGNQITQLSLKALSCCVEKDSTVLQVIDAATYLSSFQVTALATLGVGAAYLAPVIAKRMENSDLKAQMKTALAQKLQDRLTPICKNETLAKIVAANIADIAAEHFL
jgi:hypothetical protein